MVEYLLSCTTKRNRARLFVCALSVYSVSAGAVVMGPFTFDNNTGFVANDLHTIFSGTGGTLTDPIVTQQPAGAPTPTATASGNQVDLNWTVPAIGQGQSVSFTVNSQFSPINPESVVWTRNGNPLIYAPFNAAPTVAQNYGNFPDYGGGNHLHAGLDITGAADTPVRAMVNSVIVAVDGNYVIASDGTNLYTYAHVKKTTGAHGNDFTAADIGTVLTAGKNFAFVIGAANDGGGSFDHVHVEYAPNRGTDALIKKADGNYKSAADIYAVLSPYRVNPLLALFPDKDPGGNKPIIGPIFYRPEGDNVGGFKEFGQAPANKNVRKGTFINGKADLIEEIRDNQGAEPFTGNRQDPIDNTIQIYNGVMSNPYKVSYEVKGQGVVAGHDIAERTLIIYNDRYGTQDPQVTGENVHDLRRNTTTAGTSPRNYAYVLTNTDGTRPENDNVWNTRAKAGGGGSPDGTGRANAANNAEGLFPDGVYRVQGNGYDIGNDGNPANKTFVPYDVRINNWKQTAVPGHGNGVSNIQRADDVFSKDGAETTISPILSTFHVDIDLGIGEDIFLTGDNYLSGKSYNWYLFDHKKAWEEGDLFSGFLLAGVTAIADVTGFIDDSFITDSLSLFNLRGLGLYDLVIDYDFNNVFSWTLDGVGGFTLVPEPATLMLVLLGLLLLARRSSGSGNINVLVTNRTETFSH